MLALGMFSLSAQTIRIEDMKRNFSKKELFKVSGGVSASGTYYAASKMYGHLPCHHTRLADISSQGLA